MGNLSSSSQMIGQASSMLVQRPVSISSSDMCAIASPPSTASETSHVHQAPNTMTDEMHQSTGSIAEPISGSGRQRMGPAPTRMKPEPIGYDIVRGARVPRYASETQGAASRGGSAPAPTQNMRAAASTSTPSAAQPKSPARQSFSAPLPKATAETHNIGASRDSQHGCDSLQCCECGCEVAEGEGMQCTGIRSDGTQCDHVVCVPCSSEVTIAMGVPNLCTCEHHEGSEPTDFEQGRQAPTAKV